jgi:RNase adapter protein RapZ
MRIVLVSGLSGAGKSSILRTLEDLGYETIDNPPLSLLEDLIPRAEKNVAVGVDARTRGFDAAAILAAIGRLQTSTGLRPELVYATAEDEVLLRRYTESRRRHPLAPEGKVADGIALERGITKDLRDAADMLVDTTALPIASLRRLIELRFANGGPGLAVGVMSFAFPAGLPREADLVFDARFLRNPFYDPALRPLTGRDAPVARYIEADPAFGPFLQRVTDLIDFLLPKFVQEGKKYVTIAIGCTGGQHRSVLTAERLAAHLGNLGWRVGITHRELTTAKPRIAAEEMTSNT